MRVRPYREPSGVERAAVAPCGANTVCGARGDASDSVRFEFLCLETVTGGEHLGVPGLAVKGHAAQLNTCHTHVGAQHTGHWRGQALGETAGQHPSELSVAPRAFLGGRAGAGAAARRFRAREARREGPRPAGLTRGCPDGPALLRATHLDVEHGGLHASPFCHPRAGMGCLGG